MDWQPIETAPRDGTDILVCDASGLPLVYGVACSFWEFGGDDTWYEGGTKFGEPTHWQPLPSPPQCLKD